MKAGILKKLLVAMPDEGEVSFTLKCAQVVAQAVMVMDAKDSGDDCEDEVECLDCDIFHIEDLSYLKPYITIYVEPCDYQWARLSDEAEQFYEYYQRIEKDEK